jgi:hypothetical protein
MAETTNARPIDLNDFVQVASTAALRALATQRIPNPETVGGKLGGKLIWNPHIIVGLIIRNELGGDLQLLQGLPGQK